MPEPSHVDLRFSGGEEEPAPLLSLASSPSISPRPHARRSTNPSMAMVASCSATADFRELEKEEPCEVVRLGKAVGELESEIARIKLLLGAARTSKVNNEQLAPCLRELKQLQLDGEDALDELHYYRLKHQIERGNFSALFCTLSSDLQRSDELIHQHIADALCVPHEEMQGIAYTVEGIVRQARHITVPVYQALKLDKLESIVMFNQGLNAIASSRLTGSYLPEQKVHGRDTETDHIIELMTNEMFDGLKVLSIVGNGGLGKTTLAQAVFKDSRIRSHFELQMWICVSDNFDPVRIIHEMLDYFSEDRHKGITNFNKLQEILEENLESKRFLLVLDDVWDIADKWHKLLAPLDCNQAAGSFILVTTRNLSVAQAIDSVDLIRLDALRESDFWLLFKSYACGDEKYHMHRRLEAIGREIAKKLKGYPLAAKTVGALLRKNLTAQHWNRVLRDEEWKSLQNSNGIMPALKLSYDRLPCHLQECFFYCSLFPKGYKFDEAELVQMWISQGFVCTRKPSKRMEETGSEYLADLVNYGFFQYERNVMHYSDTTNGYDGYYVMHDLMHDLACLVSANECVTLDVSEPKEILPGTRHLSIICYSYSCDDPLLVEKIEKILYKVRSVRKLRTLILIGICKGCYLRFFQSIFGEAQRLRLVLLKYVNHCHDGTCADLSASVCNFLNPHHLRYLNLGVPNIGAKPQDMSKYYNLEVLGIGDMVDSSKLSNLVNLRHLIADEKVHSAIAGVGKMTSLQELQNFKVQKTAGFDIAQIKFMNELALLRISQLENVESGKEARQAMLINKTHLNTLSLSWGDSCILNGLSAQAADVLEALQPHQNLKHLQIIGYMGLTSPSWLARNPTVDSLQTLHLQNCREWILFPSMDMLSSLKKLKLVKMLNATEVCIPSLEVLVLNQMPKLEICTSFCTTELASSLRVLVIKSCHSLKDLTLFWDYHNLEVEQSIRFPSLSELTVMDCPRLVWSFPPNRGYPNEVKEMGSFPSLFKLTIYDCPNVTVACPIVNIPYVSIKGSSQALEIYKSDAELELSSAELQMLDDKILAFCNRKHRTIRIRNCPRLISVSFEAFSQLTSLSEMIIEDCPNFLQEHVMSDADNECDAATKRFVLPCLDCLDIRRCGISGKWISQMLSHAHSMFGLHLAHCPNVKLLLIICPLEEEESWSLASSSGLLDAAAVTPEECVFKFPTGVCSSLRSLHISNCPDLLLGQRHGGFAAFKSLQVLEIRRCPRLVSSIFQEQNSHHRLPLSLEELDIDHLPAEVFLGDDDMSSLRTLAIWDSPKLKSLQLHSSCAMSEVPTSRETKWKSSLGSNHVRVGRHLERVEREEEAGLQSLQALTFGNCPNLLHVPVDLHSLPCLEDLTIIDCPAISRLPEKGLPASLQLLWIYKCSEQLNEQCRMAVTEKLEVDIDGNYVNRLQT